MPVPSVKKEIKNLQFYTDKYFDAFVDFLPSLISAFIFLLVGLFVINKLSKLANRAMERRNLETSLRTFLKSIMSIGLKLILIITAAGMVGFQTSSFVAVLGAAGLAVGLALQGSLANFAGGVLVLIFKPFKVGDLIEAQGQTGQVREIQIFSTILVTPEHKTVVLPNGLLSNGLIVNQTKEGNLRFDFDISISNEHFFEDVKKIILISLSKIEHIQQAPAPVILITSIETEGYNLNIRAFAENGFLPILKTEAINAVMIAFKNNKIQLMEIVSHTVLHKA